MIVTVQILIALGCLWAFYCLTVGFISLTRDVYKAFKEPKYYDDESK